MTFRAAVSALILMLSLPLVTSAETYREEKQEHPRIARAIHELEDAIQYMKAAPHNFGGHKAAAIADSEKALVQLRAALAYRAQKDTMKGK